MEDLRCNCCGKKIKTEQGICKEDVLEIAKNWGYFSEKDGERLAVKSEFFQRKSVLRRVAVRGLSGGRQAVLLAGAQGV